MSLLSLGLLKDEREEVGREDAASPDRLKDSAHQEDPSRSLPDGSQAKHPGTNQTAGSNGTAGYHALSSFDPVSPQNGTGHSYTAESHFPAAIEELRQKISGNGLPEVFIWGARQGASPTEYLTVADRKGIP